MARQAGFIYWQHRLTMSTDERRALLTFCWVVSLLQNHFHLMLSPSLPTHKMTVAGRLFAEIYQQTTLHTPRDIASLCHSLVFHELPIRMTVPENHALTQAIWMMTVGTFHCKVPRAQAIPLHTYTVKWLNRHLLSIFLAIATNPPCIHCLLHSISIIHAFPQFCCHQ